MDLYRSIILEHFREPRNKGALEKPDAQGRVVNTSCGDELTLDLQFASDRVSAVAFHGQGCAVSQASASLLSEEMRGKTRAELAALTKEDVFRLLGGPVNPGRETCALLVLRALAKALGNA